MDRPRSLVLGQAIDRYNRASGLVAREVDRGVEARRPRELIPHDQVMSEVRRSSGTISRTRSARTDLLAIFDYVVARNPRAAGRAARRIEADVRRPRRLPPNRPSRTVAPTHATGLSERPIIVGLHG